MRKIEPHDPIHPVRRHKVTRRNDQNPDAPIEIFEDKPGMSVLLELTARNVQTLLLHPEVKLVQLDRIVDKAFHLAEMTIRRVNRAEEP